MRRSHLVLRRKRMKINKRTRYILRMEKTFAREFHKVQMRSLEEFISLLGKEIKTPDDPLGRFAMKMSADLFDVYSILVKPVMKRGFFQRKIKHDKTIGVVTDIHIPSLDVDYYIDDIVKTTWFQSVPKTIHAELEQILRNGVRNGLSYQEIAEQIRQTNPKVFTKARATLWATNEVGRAYGYADHLANQEFIRKGYILIKRWITQQDLKVRDLHRQNELTSLEGIPY